MFRILSIALLVASSRLTEKQPSFSLLASKCCSNTICGHECHTCPWAWEHCSLGCLLVHGWLLCQSKLFQSDAAGLTLLGNKRCQHSSLLSCSVRHGKIQSAVEPQFSLVNWTFSVVWTWRPFHKWTLQVVFSLLLTKTGFMVNCHTFCLHAYRCLF